MGLGIGGHDRPRRPGRVRGRQQLLVGALVTVPLRAGGQVALVELPMLGGVIQALLQALALLFLADVQHELEHHRTGLAQQALEIVDMRQALLVLRRCDPAVDHGHQHVFVLAAVEHRDLARWRHLLVNAPEIVARTFRLGWRLPAHGVYAQGAHAAEHTANRAVFARGVGALQQHQQLVALVGVEQVLQRVQRHSQRLHGSLVLRLVAQGKGFGTGVEAAQRHRLARHRLPGLPAFGQGPVAQVKVHRGGCRGGRSGHGGSKVKAEGWAHAARLHGLSPRPMRQAAKHPFDAQGARRAGHSARRALRGCKPRATEWKWWKQSSW